jgi:hypothetical protein
MLQAWLSIGYVVLLAILVLTFVLWRRGAPALAVTALVLGMPIWFGWEYMHVQHGRPGLSRERKCPAAIPTRRACLMHMCPATVGTERELATPGVRTHLAWCGRSPSAF